MGGECRLQLRQFSAIGVRSNPVIIGDAQKKAMLKPQLQIQLPDQALATFCQQWQIKELSLFGSVLREDFRPDSDIDVLVSFADSAVWGLLELVRMKRELQRLFGREVDLLTKKSIEQSHNWIRQQEILETAQVVYVAE